MNNDFSNKELTDFANSLRFQVRALIPVEIKKHDVEIRDSVYHESVFIGKQLLKDNFKDFDFCKILMQVCAEWTFHISVSLFLSNVPKNYHKLFIRKINIKIYRYTINKHSSEKDIFHDFSNSEINKNIEELVKKQYNYQMKALYKKNKIDKKNYNNAIIKNHPTEQLCRILDDKNSFNINVSLWEIIKPNLFLFLVYLVIVHVFTIYAIGHYMHKKYVACIIAIIVLCTIMWRIFRISADFKITPPSE